MAWVLGVHLWRANAHTQGWNMCSCRRKLGTAQELQTEQCGVHLNPSSQGWLVQKVCEFETQLDCMAGIRAGVSGNSVRSVLTWSWDWRRACQLPRSDSSLLFMGFWLLTNQNCTKDSGLIAKAKLHVGAYGLAQLANELDSGSGTGAGAGAGTEPEPTEWLGEASAQTSQRSRGRNKGVQPNSGAFFNILITQSSSLPEPEWRPLWRKSSK